MARLYRTQFHKRPYPLVAKPVWHLPFASLVTALRGCLLRALREPALCVLARRGDGWRRLQGERGDGEHGGTDIEVMGWTPPTASMCNSGGVEHH